MAIKAEFKSGIFDRLSSNSRKTGSVALSGKILLVRIIENNKIDAYFR